MKAVNAAHARFLKNPESLDKADLSETAKKMIRDYVAEYSWEKHPYAPFQLSNNNAEIRRLRERVKEL